MGQWNFTLFVLCFYFIATEEMIAKSKWGWDDYCGRRVLPVSKNETAGRIGALFIDSYCNGCCELVENKCVRIFDCKI